MRGRLLELSGIGEFTMQQILAVLHASEPDALLKSGLKLLHLLGLAGWELANIKKVVIMKDLGHGLTSHREDLRRHWACPEAPRDDSSQAPR